MGENRAKLKNNSAIGAVRGSDGKANHVTEGLVPNVGLATKRSRDDPCSTDLVCCRDESVESADDVNGTHPALVPMGSGVLHRDTHVCGMTAGSIRGAKVEYTVRSASEVTVP